MYTVKVKNQLSFSHSLKDEYFGDAKNTHHVQLNVEVVFTSDFLNQHHVVIEFSSAHQIAKGILNILEGQNLDQLPQFAGKQTTLEFLAHYLHDCIKREIRYDFEGPIEVVLNESENCWASYKK